MNKCESNSKPKIGDLVECQLENEESFIGFVDFVSPSKNAILVRKCDARVGLEYEYDYHVSRIDFTTVLKASPEVVEYQPNIGDYVEFPTVHAGSIYKTGKIESILNEHIALIELVKLPGGYSTGEFVLIGKRDLILLFKDYKYIPYGSNSIEEEFSNPYFAKIVKVPQYVMETGCTRKSSGFKKGDYVTYISEEFDSINGYIMYINDNNNIAIISTSDRESDNSFVSNCIMTSLDKISKVGAKKTAAENNLAFYEYCEKVGMKFFDSSEGLSYKSGSKSKETCDDIGDLPHMSGYADEMEYGSHVRNAIKNNTSVRGNSIYRIGDSVNGWRQGIRVHLGVIRFIDPSNSFVLFQSRQGDYNLGMLDHIDELVDRNQ